MKSKTHHDGFWSDWYAQDSPESEAGRHHRRRRRGDRSERWRRHFHDHAGAYPEEHWLFGGRRFSPWHHGRPGFNPFVANVMSLGGGLLPVLVLQIISEQPRYGNEVMKLLRERTAGQWVSNPGAIYPLLTQLEEEGLINGKWADDRKRTMRIYRITPRGEEELARLKEIVQPKLSEAVGVLQEIERSLNSANNQTNYNKGDET